MEYLTAQEVKEAKKNVSADQTTRSIWHIIYSNTFTFINGMVLVLAALVATTGSLENLTFLFVIIINTLIGSVQEIRSKLSLERLELLSRSSYRVNRDARVVKVYSEELVLGDYLHLTLGDQIPVDGIILEGEVEVDESLLTGESTNVTRLAGSKLLSGSNVVSGSCLVRVTAVGEDSYINQFAQKTRVFKRYPSQLRNDLNKMLHLISLILIPTALLLFARNYQKGLGYNETVLMTSGALVGMIPEGLMLLVSVCLAVSALKLSRKKVLVEELYCVETLASVDVLCFDKTGTITTGNMEVVDLPGPVENVLQHYLANFEDDTSSSLALKRVLDLTCDWEIRKKEPFSSKRKYSSLQVEGVGTYFFGAAEFLDLRTPLSQKEEEAKCAGFRVLTLAFSPDYLERPENLELIGSVTLADEIKENARETFQYFESQDVEIKIISGDNHLAVLGVAVQAGFSPNSRAIDLSQVADEELEGIVLSHDIFGRVSPEQKEKIVEILQDHGRTVGMSGDGVNDVLALKKANVSFAMKGATSAAKGVANVVFVTDDFSVFYDILMEGRRVINNIQKVECLFLTKTFFSVAFSLLSILFALKFPFTPIQFTLISTITIGVPSFFLTFEENGKKVARDFMRGVFKNAIIGATILVTSSLLVNILIQNHTKAGVVCLILALLNGLLMIARVTAPVSAYNRVLLGGLSLGAVGAIILDLTLIEGNIPPFTIWDYSVALLTIIAIILIYQWMGRKKEEKKK